MAAAVVDQPAAAKATGVGAPARAKAVEPSAAEDRRGWSTNIFGCCADCGTCWMSCLCTCCLLAKISRRMKENCCVGVCLNGGIMALRTKLRMMYGIKGSLCGDWCAAHLCCLCTVCQLDRELRHMGR